MKNYKINFMLVFLSIMFFFFGLSGSYFGQKPPGIKPEIFAPGIISTGYSERIAAFTPDGKELYYVLAGAPHFVILYTMEVDGRWIKPQIAPFSGKYLAEFNISPAGNKIVFASSQPLNGVGKPTESLRVWMVERNEMGWDEPKCLIPSIRGYPSLTKKGDLYFNSAREDAVGEEDIYVSKLVNGEYTEPVNIGSLVNSEIQELDPFVAPDESYIIFCKRDPDGFGGVDLFISFRKDDDTWTKSINMGENINSSASEFCPSVSPDGKYFFFTSNRRLHKPYSEIPLTYERKLKILNSPGNGNGDIYWVDTKIIEDLKPKELK